MAGWLTLISALPPAGPALAVFVTLWLIDIIEWRVFLVALSVEILVYMILVCVFKHGRHLQYILAGLVLSVFILLYVLTLPLGNNCLDYLIRQTVKAIQ